MDLPPLYLKSKRKCVPQNKRYFKVSFMSKSDVVSKHSDKHAR